MRFTVEVKKKGGSKRAGGGRLLDRRQFEKSTPKGGKLNDIIVTEGVLGEILRGLGPLVIPGKKNGKSRELTPVS